MSQKNMVLPEWMAKENDCTPQKDRNGFITKSLLGFMRLFRHFHVQKNESISQTRALLRLVLAISLIVLCALTKSLFFCGSVAAALLVYLCFMKAEIIKRVLSTGLSAAAFTALVMLPAFFIYRSNSIIYITLKVFLSTSMLALFSLTTAWNKTTASLRMIHFPSFIIFILDLTIHYILVLGNIAYEMLFALKLRSVGKNKSKENSFSGILGTVFLKSMVMSEETQQAMECRLFNGEYGSKKIKVRLTDFIPLFVLAVFVGLFVYLSIASK